MNPEFVCFIGPMFGGKSSALLQALDRYQYQKKSVFVFKPVIDDRYDGKESIITHCGMSFPATPIEKGDDIMSFIAANDKKPDVVAVDEAFLIPGVAKTLIWLFRNVGIDVIVSSLNLSAMGRPFDEIQEMLPWATCIKQCSAICTICRRDAKYTYKKISHENEIEIGGSELYEPRCYEHHLVINCSVE